MSGSKLKRVTARGLTSLAATLLLAGCSLFSGATDPVAESATPSSEPGAELTTTTLTSGSLGGELDVDSFNDGVFCDGNDRRAALVYGAEPGETITFTTPMPVDIEDGVADDQGAYQLLWRCEPHETALFWDLTATGKTSKRTASFQVKGSGEAPPAEKELLFEPAEEALSCNGNSQIVGWVDGLEPGEAVTFTSPDTDELLDANAGTTGRIEINWSCQPEEAGKSWMLTASGLQSGRSISISLTGTQPEPLVQGPIQVSVSENPFVCDRGRRVVAQLSNLTPGVAVSFEAAPGGSLESGRASGIGTLEVFWRCVRDDDGVQWTVTATEASTEGAPARSASILFTGAANPNPTAVSLIEDPFICDGTRHPVATLSNFLGNEFIDFTSPQSEGLRQGQADADGGLTVNWQCTIDDVGKQWEVTATGATSGVDITFTITAAAPAE